MILQVYAMNEEGQLEPIELTHHERDVLEAKAYLESWTGPEAVTSWLVAAAVGLAEDADVQNMVGVRDSYRTQKTDNTNDGSDSAK